MYRQLGWDAARADRVRLFDEYDRLEIRPPYAQARRERVAFFEARIRRHPQIWDDVLGTADRRMMARAIAGRLLHEPTVRMRALADREDSYLQVSALRELFGLDAGTEPEAAEEADIASLEDRRRGKRS